uniref:Uncharacterized protein n=1 Tax=Tetranychus urticae TaxID=32264 RepID=T1KWU8_TETUR
MPVDLRNPRNINKSGGLHAIPSGPFQHFHHFANPSSVLVPIATGSSGHSPGPYHESSFPHLKYLEYTKLMGEALMQHFHQANNASFGVTLNLNGNVNGNVNGKSMNNIQGELVKGFYKETLTNSPNRENDTKNDK